MQVSRLLVLAAVARKEGVDDWERFVMQALSITYKRSLLCVKDRPLQYLLWWLRSPILEKMAHSEKAFICATMLDCLPKDSPDAPELLLVNKEYVLDTESAMYSRLNFIIGNLEKEVAAAKLRDNTTTEKTLAALTEARNDLKTLESERVAFPNALVMLCKVQNFIETFREKEMLQQGEQEAWYEDIAAYRDKLQK
jgi:hypothetical protein